MNQSARHDAIDLLPATHLISHLPQENADAYYTYGERITAQRLSNSSNATPSHRTTVRNRCD